MSTKIDIAIVAETLKKHRDITPTTLREIVQELNEIAQPEVGDEPTPRSKSQFVLLTGTQNQDLGWVFQMNESDSPGSLLDRIMKTAHDFNASKRGRLLPVKSVGEAIESVPRKFWADSGLKVKTKIAVAMIKTDNKLSEEPTV